MKLETMGLTKKFGAKTAVKELDLTLTSGVYGLLGANGAGKTTLMRLLCGLLTPTSGEILLDGKSAGKLGEKYRDLLGYLPQHFGYYPEFTAADFLLYVSALKGLGEKAAKRKSRELLEAVGLEGEARQKIKTFSGGMKERLGIAQALLNDPCLLILDEPTAGLDPKERVRFRNLISAFAKDRIVILSTHIVSDVEFIAEEIIMMRAGQVIQFGKPQEIIRKIDGKVWECAVPTAYAEQYAARYNTSNLRNTDRGETVLRIIAHRPPMENAQPVPPNLEDLYLFYFKGGKHKMKTLIRFEVRKILSRKLTQAAVAVVLLLSMLFTVSTYQNMYAFDGASREGSGGEAVAIDHSIAEKYAGPLTDEKVRQMMEDFAPRADLHGMNAKYLYFNATQSAVFARFADRDGRWNGLTVADVFGEEEIRIGYINGWLKTSDDLVKPLLLLCVVVMVMAAPVFAGEYSSGVDNIILSSRHGRSKCAAAKVAAAGLAALLVTAVTCAVGILPAFLLYGGDGLGCSILFAPAEYTEAYIPFPITVGTLLAYQVLLAFTATAGVTGVTLLFSAFAKNQTVALVAAGAVIFLPMLLPVSERSPLFRYIALVLPPYHVQFVSLMSVERFGGGVLYALLAVPVAAVLMGVGGLLSKEVFAKHQVS